ncbi:radical SAM protein [Ectothiorhodospiraceae bacterium BW-2]|nr:radical SAM protein [Ectothiorhodospiraceae bacterium BW-2]
MIIDDQCQFVLFLMFFGWCLMSDKPILVLCYPNQRWVKDDVVTTWDLPPTTLCLLATMVEDIVDVKIVDAQKYNLSIGDFVEIVKGFSPKYFGVSVITSEYAETLDIAANELKNALPDVTVIAGGVHITTDPVTVMANTNIDYGCNGEGEYLLRELLLYLENRGEIPAKGLLYRDDLNRLTIQDRALIDDLDQLPFPNYDYVNLDDYLKKDGRYGFNRAPELPGIALTISRGCPYPCTFCQVPFISGRKIRVPSPDKVVDHLEFFVRNFGLKSFVIQDDNLFAAKPKAKAILNELIRRQLNLKWVAIALPIFAIDDEMLDLMKESGCVGANVAIESGDERVLRDIIKKPIKNLPEIPAKIQNIKDRGMYVLANFVIGNPGETWEEIRKTIWFAEHCNADYIKIFVMVPIKGTTIYDIALATNAMDVENEESYKIDWRYSKVKSNEWTGKDVSILRVYEWDRINFSPERIERISELWGMSIEDISELRKKTRDNLVFNT